MKAKAVARAAWNGKKTWADRALVVSPPWQGKGVCFPELDPVLQSQPGIFYKVSLPRGPLEAHKDSYRGYLWGGWLEAKRSGIR